MPAGVAWHANNVSVLVRQKLLRNANKAGAHLAEKVRQKLAVQGPPASAPGEPAHRESGDLQSQVYFEVTTHGVLASLIGRDSISIIVGSHSDHAYVTEVGTSKMASRPWLRPTLAEEGPTVGRIMVTGS